MLGGSLQLNEETNHPALGETELCFNNSMVPIMLEPPPKPNVGFQESLCTIKSRTILTLSHARPSLGELLVKLLLCATLWYTRYLP